MQSMRTSVLSKNEIQTIAARPSPSVARLKAHTNQLGTILTAARLALRVTVGLNSVVIGNAAASGGDAVEFIFASEKEAENILIRARLIDFAFAYFSGEMIVKGSIHKAVEVLDSINEATDKKQTILEYLRLVAFRAGKAFMPAIAQRFDSLDHYSLSAAAYELFLDGYMQYTCGRFETDDEDITQAQVAKFNLIGGLARQHLGTLQGKTHLDIGSGWGGMGAYFQAEFGMHSIGNTNCETQMQYAQQRYGAEILYGDFSVLSKLSSRFDLVTVVGMIEHLTPHRRSQLLKVVNKVLSPGGLLYLQCIVKPPLFKGGDVYRLTEKVVFPGHYLESEAETEARLKAAGFRILASFEHGRDYGLTTAHWVDKLQQNEKAVIALIGAKQYRIFLGYLAFASRKYSRGCGRLMRYMLARA